jgi:TruB family pseudouridylate synthase (N terminal domain)
MLLPTVVMLVMMTDDTAVAFCPMGSVARENVREMFIGTPGAMSTSSSSDTSSDSMSSAEPAIIAREELLSTTEPPPPPPPPSLYRSQGLFAVAKPLDWTSNNVVSYIRGILERDARHRGAKPAKVTARHSKGSIVRVGHGGTLDPLATGVLVIGVGRGTKQLQRYGARVSLSDSRDPFIGTHIDPLHLYFLLLSSRPNISATWLDPNATLPVSNSALKQQR